MKTYIYVVEIGKFVGLNKIKNHQIVEFYFKLEFIKKL